MSNYHGARCADGSFNCIPSPLHSLTKANSGGTTTGYEGVHVDDSVDPVRDLNTIQSELCAKDLVEFAASMEKEQKEIRKNPKMKLSAVYKETMAKVEEHLKANRGLYGQEWTEPEVSVINEKLAGLITTKPVVYLVNISKKDILRKKNKWLAKVKAWIDENGGGPMIPYSVELEAELADMDETARAAYLEETKAVSKLDKIIKAGYTELALQSFFACGEDEVRAWTVQAGSSAPVAAGVIHTDFQRCFIKAEVVAWEDYDKLQDTKGLDKVKAAGKWRQEGKSYVMKDGDIVTFAHNAGGAKKK